MLLLSGIAAADKLSVDERLEIERSMTAEFAIAKVVLPRSKKPLVIHSNGALDQPQWEEALQNAGLAAKAGDQVQITRVKIESNRIVFEINGGGKGHGHWYDNLQIGMGGDVGPMGAPIPGSGQVAPGSFVAVVFPHSVPPINSTQLRQMLAPIFNFDKPSAAQQFVENLPPPIKEAIKQQHAIAGMNRDMVLLAMGKPRNKSRETDKDGNDIEDWIYGDPPGKVTFVRFSEGKVIRVEDSYANVGGTTAPPLPPAR